MHKKSLLQRLQNNPRPVVLDVWAPWCMPCRSLRPKLERVAEANKQDVDFVELNADEDPELAQRLGVHAIPTVIAFREGKEVQRLIGNQPIPALERLFRQANGEELPEPAAMGQADRILRLVISAALLIVGASAANPAVWYILAGLAFFSAVYDRCPLWQSVSTRIRAILGRE